MSKSPKSKRSTRKTDGSRQKNGGASPPAATTGVGIESLLGQRVVLDTEGPIMYLGTLSEVLPVGFWLENADIRDRNEGHVSKESYACEARLNGIRANRRRIFVMAKVVISASALDDVIVEFPEE